MAASMLSQMSTQTSMLTSTLITKMIHATQRLITKMIHATPELITKMIHATLRFITKMFDPVLWMLMVPLGVYLKVADILALPAFNPQLVPMSAKVTDDYVKSDEKML
eukprot:11132954-Karenia_brevis.AAC.1